MGYTTYVFYATQYFGDVIAEADFEKWNARASRYVDGITCRRLLTAYPTDDYTNEQIQLCVCELAEKMLETDKYLKASAIEDSGTSGVIQSLSAGSESITYATGETVYASVIKDERSRNAFFYASAAEYLSGLNDANGVHLLWRGYY